MKADPPMSDTSLKDVVDGSPSDELRPPATEQGARATMPKARSKSTPRSREHRNRKRDSGGEVLSFTMGPSATTALLILRTIHGTSKSKTVEAILIAEAIRLVATPKAARALTQKGLIDEQSLNAWLAVLDASKSVRSMNTSTEESASPPERQPEQG